MKRFRCQRGSAMVEFAMLLPVLLLVVIVGLDLLLAGANSMALWAASREASRGIALGDSVSSARGDANHVLQIGMVPANQVQWSVSDSGDWVSVTLTYDRPNRVPGLPLLMGQPPFAQSIRMERTMTFRKRG